MIKKYFVGSVVIVIVIGAILSFSGCAKPESTPESGSELMGFGPMKGVAQKPDGTPYTFEYLAPEAGADWHVCANNLLYSRIENMAGGQLTIQDAAGSVDNQLAAFENAIVKAPDAIFFSTFGTKTIHPWVEKATEAGIPVFDVDHVSYHEDIVFEATPHTVDQGLAMGQYFVDLVEEKGGPITAFYIWGNLENEADQERFQGWREKTEGNPNITTIQSAASGYKDDTTMNFVMDTLPAHPEINAILTQYDMTGGVTEALRTIGRLYPLGHPDHVSIIVVAGEKEVLQHMREGWVDGFATNSPYEIYDIFVKGMLTVLCTGNPLPQQILIPGYLVTMENIENPRWNAPGVWGDLMMAGLDWDDWPLLDTSALGIEAPTHDMKLSGY